MPVMNGIDATIVIRNHHVLHDLKPWHAPVSGPGLLRACVRTSCCCLLALAPSLVLIC